MKDLLLIFGCILIFSISSCSKHGEIGNEKSFDHIQTAMKKFDADIARDHPDLSKDDRELLSQYVISHLMRGEQLPKNLIIADVVEEQRKVNKAVSQIH